MRTDEFITSIRKKYNIIVTAGNGELKVKASRDALTKEVVEELRSRKAEIIDFFNRAGAGNAYSAIPATEKKHYYKLSSAQKRLYFLHEFNRESLAYNAPRIVELHGAIDKERLSTAFNRLLDRHEILRTSFGMAELDPVQFIAEKATLTIAHFTAARCEVDAVIRSFIRPFDLAEAPLLRVGLIEVNPTGHVLMIDMHHSITDGISNDVLIKDFMLLYNNEELPPLQLQYKDFAEWQQSPEQQQLLTAQKDFWMRMFAEETGSLVLPADYSRPAVQSHEGDAISFELDAEDTAHLKALAKKEEVTLFMLLLSVYYILMAKLANEEDVVIGIPVAGRQHADVERMIGMFVNTLPVRSYPKANLSFKEFLSEIKDTILTCFNNQDYPYEALIDELKIKRDLSHNPLFDVVFTYQNFEAPPLKIPGLTLKPYKEVPVVAQFDLLLAVFESGPSITLQFDYATALFKTETVQRFAAYFKKVVAAVLANPDVTIADIDLLSDDEKQQLLVAFNNTKATYPASKTIIDLFEEQAGKNPAAKAVTFGDNVISYLELKQQSDKIAVYLKEVMSVQPGDLVGIMLEREAWLLPCLFGILKTGAAYVPLDPHYPADRINAIIQDADLKSLISRTSYLDESLAVPPGIVNLDIALNSILQQDHKVPDVKVDSNSIAYVIFTSGSTGKPKGVMIEHHSVVNRIGWMQKAYPINENDVILQKTSISFDVSVWELFWWSVVGASVCLLKPGGEKEPMEIVNTIQKHKVTTMHFVPSMLSIFLSTLSEKELLQLRSLRQVFSSGEALKASHVKLFATTVHKHWGTDLINLYGPTEATVDVTYYKCSFEEDGLTIPIGKPIDNTWLYVLDKSGRLCPIGVSGELCIGGVGVARGYLNNTSLTEQKFVADPFVQEQKIYRTGDLTRWLPDGTIEYLGRIDHQVKLRGFRIELEEIEYQLSAYPSIKESVVALKGEEEDKFLVGYYVSDKELNTAELRNHLLGKLPEYMVPAYFLRIDNIPLSVNGKANKKSLPDPDKIQVMGKAAPQNELEQQLLSLWQQVLPAGNITTDVDFFSAGGNSIKLIRLFKLISDNTPYKVEVRNLFEHRTITAIAAFIAHKYNEQPRDIIKKKNIIEF